MGTARTWVPRAVALAAFCVYVVAAPPSFYWLDSAELSAAAARWGAPHPTGFPLYCLGARLVSLLPVGEIAFRINLFSALCGAATVLWVARLVAESCRDDGAAVTGGAVAGGALAATLLLFRHSTVAEVYAPTAALLALALVLLARVARGEGARAGLALAVVAGLGLGLHSSFRLLLALPVMVLFAVRLYRGARWPLLGLLLALGTGAALHSYLPVRSATGRTAEVDWGHPRTLDSLVAHSVTAERIRTAFGDQISSSEAAVVSYNGRRFARQVVEQLGPLALLAALAGGIWLVRRGRSERWLFASLLCVIGGDFVYSAWLNPMGLRDMQNGLPLMVGMCASAGIGLAWLGRLGGPAAPYVTAVAGLIVLTPIASASWTPRWAAASSYAPRAWSERLLDDAPPRAIALVTNDSTAAGLLYLRTVEGARPDLPVLVLQHIARDRERTVAVLSAAGSEVDPQAVRRSLFQAPGGVYWELGPEPPPRGLVVSAGVPAARLTLPGALASAGASRKPDDLQRSLAELVRVVRHGGAQDPAARFNYANAVTQLGLLAYRRGDIARAETCFRAALGVRPDHVPAYVNLGVVLGRQERFAEAAEASERAISLNPVHPQALVNAARFRLRLGDDSRAAGYLERALAVDPDRSSAWELAGLVDARAGRFAQARDKLERALQLNPANKGAKWTLDKLPR